MTPAERTKHDRLVARLDVMQRRWSLPTVSRFRPPPAGDPGNTILVLLTGYTRSGYTDLGGGQYWGKTVSALPVEPHTGNLVFTSAAAGLVVAAEIDCYCVNLRETGTEYHSLTIAGATDIGYRLGIVMGSIATGEKRVYLDGVRLVGT